ncbi:MAG: BcepIL02 gp43 [Microvirga sp.]|nr:BcepIL02 gp43 [Microvirga sp.]
MMRTPHRWVRPKRQLPPGFVVPCQPTLAAKVPAGDGWLHELKHDGFRVLAFKDGDTVRLWSRNARDWSAEFVAITEAMRALPFKRVMLDGEAVAHCLDGLPDFHRLLGDGQATACFYAFDLVWLEAQDVRGVELIGRRRMLQKALKKTGPVLRFSEHLPAEQGEAMFRHACAMGLEGIVSKRATSRYNSGACRSWLKVKNPAYERRTGA